MSLDETLKAIGPFSLGSVTACAKGSHSNKTLTVCVCVRVCVHGVCVVHV